MRGSGRKVARGAETRALEALALRDGAWLETEVYDDTSTTRTPTPFEAVELEVGRLFLPRDADEPSA
jgi:hypothetical protein